MVERWRPPNPDFIEIKFDAAFKNHTKESCSDLVYRNSDGQVLGSRIILNRYIPSPFTAKALACLQAVQIGFNLGFRKVIIGGDAHSIIRKLQIEQYDKSVISAYIKESKEHISLL
ncbi:hypothetical protein PVK06_036207 [Gossypium arboreum]|uniref:RNase H type-1 domain-containing protein n=1 Tax=Gossypium arboreum TaxID=29729 RepID=A0ABR0NIX3_GOSAR|nr:hypothetical protein PVK06_036207 [Gossypium arboreum]